MGFMVEEPRKYNERPIGRLNSLKKLLIACSIAAPIHYGWALQLSLLIPYVQFLGVPHSWTSIIWLCGPISGMFIQPIVGHYSDQCTSRFGRRRPFLLFGTLLLCFGIFLIAFSSDIGFALGDSYKGHKIKIRATIIFILGFWVLDTSNNVIQGPCRALLADLSGNNEAKVTIANATFSFFMALGNSIGYGVGSYAKISDFLPFTRTQACYAHCADLKACFILAIVFLILNASVVVTMVEEEVLDPLALPQVSKKGKFALGDLTHYLIHSIKNLPRPMKYLIPVTAFNWAGFFPFFMYSTDWMGKEVYGGNPTGTVVERALYHSGVWVGTLGLMLCVMVVGIVSLFMEHLVVMVGSIKRLWGISSFVLAICMFMTTITTKLAYNFRASNLEMVESPGSLPPPPDVKLSAFAIFAISGLPHAVTSTLPFALASIFAFRCEAGQGLFLGLLNLSIVIPQIFVALVSGPLDSLFGGSNIPAFFLGAIAAALSSICAFVFLEN